MERNDEYEELIAKYLEGKMSIDEEELFIQQLNANDDLRKQYEEELLVSALIENDHEAIAKPVFNTKKQQVSNKEKNTKAYPTKISSLTKYGVAAVLIIAAGTGIFFFKAKSRLSRQPETVNINQKKNKVIVDSSVGNYSVNKSPGLSAQQLYSKFYSSYTAQNDPVEISNYYEDYKTNNYNKVIKARTSDYSILGTDSRQDVLNSYMLLYKGLSYLSTNNSGKAITNFSSILSTSNQHDHLYYAAEWYLALTYLKENKLKDAKPVLDNLIKSASPYKKKAQQIIEQLR